MLLRDKVVVISGVGPGLGQALGCLAAAEGARVVLAARSKDYLERLAGEIVGKGGQAIAVSCDVGDAAQCRALAETALSCPDADAVRAILREPLQ